MTDLLSAPIAPGAQGKTGGNFPLGSRPFGILAAPWAMVDLIGQASGSFTIDAVTFEDRGQYTWIEVTATNTSAEVKRLNAMIEFQVP